jgi:hypothetical protein
MIAPQRWRPFLWTLVRTTASALASCSRWIAAHETTQHCRTAGDYNSSCTRAQAYFGY